jgi:2-dehydro-3-deoxyglucarate aldolase/4-hydroxy-2-oxoheptanedioate aldolase
MNKVKRKLEEGGIAVGTMMMEFSTTGISRIASEAGADFAVFDMEHSGWSMETIRMLMATTRAAEIVPMVRVPALEYHFISRALDVGAMGIVVPMVSSEDQAKEIVSYAKYAPEGKRGVAFGVAHDHYRGGNLVTKMKRANDEQILLAQIENAEGVENVDKIAAVDGLDGLWIGQYDLTTSMGLPGRMDHPFFKEAAHKVMAACRKHRKIAVMGAMDVNALAHGPGVGFRMLVYLSDVWIYQQALKKGITKIREAISQHKGDHH